MNLGKDGCIKVCVCVRVHACVCVFYSNGSQRTGVIVRTKSGEGKKGARWANQKAIIAGGVKGRITRNYLTGPWQRRHNSRHVLHTGVEHCIVYLPLFLSRCLIVLMNLEECLSAAVAQNFL